MQLVIPGAGCPKCGYGSMDSGKDGGLFSLKGDVPEEGSLVGCARCNSVFRVVPDGLEPVEKKRGVPD